MRVLSSEKQKPVSVALSQQPPFSKSKTTDGLAHLEYRGYDSAGVAVISAVTP